MRKLVFAVLRGQGVGRRVLAVAAEADSSQLRVLLLSAFEPSLAVELTRPRDPRVSDVPPVTMDKDRAEIGVA